MRKEVNVIVYLSTLIGERQVEFMFDELARQFSVPVVIFKVTKSEFQELETEAERYNRIVVKINNRILYGQKAKYYYENLIREELNDKVNK